MSDANIGGIFFLGLVAAAAMMKRGSSTRSSRQSPHDTPRRDPERGSPAATQELQRGRESGPDAGTKNSGFAGYPDPQEWREATFGDVRNTRDPGREGGFAGYASKADWHRATFGDQAPRSGAGARSDKRFGRGPGGR